MFFYNFVYKCACTYSWLRSAVSHAFYSPLVALKQKLLDDNAIRKASIIDITDFHNGMKTEVIYEFSWLECLYHLYLMWFVFGQNAWVERFRYVHGKYSITDSRLGRQGVYLHVILENGKEFLTDELFDSYAQSNFTKPKGKYLCVMMGNQDITHLYRRFATSWNNLKLRVIDFTLIAMHLDEGVYKYVMKVAGLSDICIITIDDDTVEEIEFANCAFVSF